MVSTFLPFIILWGWGKLGLDATDPVVLWGIRALYAVSLAIQFGMVQMLIAKVHAQSTKPENAKIIKYVVRRPQTTIMSETSETNPKPEPFEYKQHAVYEYDLEQLAPLKSLTPIAITIGIHLYFGATQPLVIQAFTGPLRLLENAVFKIYYMGAQMERPFPVAPSPFASLLGQPSEKEQCDEWDQQQQAKSKKGGKKDDSAVVAAKSKKDD